MINHLSLFRRLWHSAVGWSWAFNGLRLASGVLLLPLLLHLPASDFGFYYVFLSLVALAPLLDMGFLASIDRAISYAMGGATELRAQGMVPTGSMDAPPNFPLLWQLLDATRTLYRYLSLGVILILSLIHI